MKCIKKVLLSLLLIPLIFCSVCLVGCKKDNADNDDIQLDGVNVVLSVQEAEQLLNQAKLEATQVGGEILQASDINAKDAGNNKYTKADLLLIINQIKNNILSSNKISAVTHYDMEGASGYETCVVTQTEAYFYTKQGVEEGETWYKNEDGTLYYYDIYDEGEGKTYIKRVSDPFENNGVYDFCQGKFTFTCKTLTEDDIEKFVINKNKMFIKLNATIFVDGDLEVSERFEVRNGKIVKDHLKWEGVDLTVEYTYDDEVDTTPLNLPDYPWVSEN